MFDNAVGEIRLNLKACADCSRVFNCDTPKSRFEILGGMVICPDFEYIETETAIKKRYGKKECHKPTCIPEPRECYEGCSKCPKGSQDCIAVMAEKLNP